MPAGRKRQPTRLKILRGNPGRRPLPKNEIHVPLKADVKPPSFLGKIGKKHFEEMLKMLGGVKVITQTDLDALAMYCDAYERWVEAQTQLRKHGMLVRAPSGYPMISPYLTASRSAFNELLKLLPEFGLTPASRTKVTPQEKEKQENPFEKFLNA